ncbi:MAG: porin, partial [Pseudomonas sp.]|nr:porin [Pseudomonas sp.]
MKKNNNAQLICQLSAVAAMMLAGSVHAADAFSADSEWMTGDWGGERT